MFPGAPPQGFTLLPKPRRLQCTFQRPWSQLSWNWVARFRDRLEIFWYQKRVHIARPFLVSRFHNMKGVSPKSGPKYGPAFGTRNLFFLQKNACSGQPRVPFFGTRRPAKRHQSSCMSRLVTVSSHRMIQRNGVCLVIENLIQPSIKERGRLAASPFHAIAVVLHQSHKMVDLSWKPCS